MSDRWISSFFRESSIFPWRGNTFSPFNEARRMFDEIDRIFDFPNYSRNTAVGDLYKFGEGCDEIVDKDGNFSVKMDVSHFAPNELKVDIVDRCLIVEGKHQEKNDNYGSIQRMFVRKYLLPDNVNEDDVKSELTKDGFLSIKAKNHEAIEENKVKNIPITYK